MSKIYRLMIYFAHSTLVIYSATIVSNDKMSVKEFRDKNRDVVTRVFDEGLLIMHYEINIHQMEMAIMVYLQGKYFPSSVENTEVIQLGGIKNYAKDKTKGSSPVE